MVLRPAYAIIHREVLYRLKIKVDPRNLIKTLLRARSITSVAVRWRSVNRLYEIDLDHVRMFKVVLVPSAPMNEERLATAGSLRMTSASCCCLCDMAGNEMDSGACVMP